jgi:hypothetical protein
MTTSRVPSAADLLFIVAAPIQAVRGAVKLTQSDGDLAAHIRMGEVILHTRHIPAHSLASYTAATEPLIAHGWLSEVLFALLYRAGGLPLLVVLTGILIGLTHALVAVFLRRRGVDPRWAIVAAVISLILASTHWLTRPHMFSILGSLLTLWLLESKRPHRELFLVPLFVLWANLHGGWLYGLMLIAAYAVGDLLEAWIAVRKTPWLLRARSDAIALLVAAAATLANPFGLRLHGEVLSAVTSGSLAASIEEYLPPNFQEIGQLPFLLVILLSIALIAVARNRMPFTWLVVFCMSLFFGLRSFRNIALFGVTAWPLVALHAARGWPLGRRHFPYFTQFARIDSQTHVGPWAAPMMVLLILLGLNRGKVGGYSVIADQFDAHKFPVAAVQKARQASLGGRVYTPWVWGGYLMYAWPGARIHVDPLKFSQRTLDSYARIDGVRQGWQSELDQWNVATLILQPRNPLARTVAADTAWQLWYRDSTAAIFRRRQPLLLRR